MKEIFLHHKGVSAIARYSEEEDLYHGKIEGVPDLVTFGGKTPEDAKEDFEHAVDDFLNQGETDAKEAEYMTMLCKLDEERAAGLEEGQAKERIRSAKSFVKTALLNNCSEDMILNMLSSMYDWSIEEAKEFYQKSKLDVD